MPAGQIKTDAFFLQQQGYRIRQNPSVWGNERNEDSSSRSRGRCEDSKTETPLESLDLLSTYSSHDLRLLFPTLELPT